MAIIEFESVEWVKGCRESEEYPGVTTLRQPAGPIWLLVAPGWLAP